ncbi:hypothetical protein DL546_005803 [Coniochaeta pulveracea]|uniref:Zn(2)-C6 fungal-type domain-containing protein n=1 Tax=Coniochaeta pulveracea TaxID=177199 RepID=A0A420Y703_9PEZI|nr:hypothetical protein DL546_005803 [Coniochaeta pulveracea]
MSEPEGPPRKKQRKIGSRSCDGCKVRKVKCTEIPPCVRCRTIGIECTFLKAQSTRGPRTLRAKTLQQIQEAQQTTSQQDTPLLSRSNDGHTHHQGPDGGTEPGRQEGQPISVESLVLRLCIYRLRLFPVWPIMAVEEVIAALHRDSHDVETFALALAVGAATMAQLKLDRFKDQGVSDDCTAGLLEAECQRIRVQLNSETANLNRLRTSFFLHIYHENLDPGGTKSLLYLREAITLAQIMGLDRARTYAMLNPAEDRLRRRILWLLFVTERGVAALHKLPIILGPADKLPPLNSSESEDEAHILPAFKKLVHLFWIFDQSGAFEILQDAAEDGNMDISTSTATGTSEKLRQEVLATLQRRLAAAPLDLSNATTDIQKADIWVTRQWMQILIWRATWRATLGHWRTSSDSSSSVPDSGPVQIAQEFLTYISRIPSAALEAHGPAIELKVYEIASAVADTLTSHSGSFIGSGLPASVLNRLQQILATSRGGNSSLLGLLTARIAHMGLMAAAPLPSLLGVYDITAGFDMTGHTHVVEEITDEDGDQEQDWAGQHSATRISPPLSPWLSLVTAAADLEHQQGLGTDSFAGDMSSAEELEGRGQGSVGNGMMDWFGLS